MTAVFVAIGFLAVLYVVLLVRILSGPRQPRVVCRVCRGRHS